MSDISVTERSNKVLTDLQKAGGSALPTNKERSPTPDKSASASSHKRTDKEAKPFQHVDKKAKTLKPLGSKPTSAKEKEHEPEIVKLTKEFGTPPKNTQQAKKATTSPIREVLEEARTAKSSYPGKTELEMIRPKSLESSLVEDIINLLIDPVYAEAVPKAVLEPETAEPRIQKLKRETLVQRRPLDITPKDLSPLEQIGAATKPVKIRSKLPSSASDIGGREHQILTTSSSRSRIRSYDDFIGIKIDSQVNPMNNFVVRTNVPAITLLPVYSTAWAARSQPRSRFGSEGLFDFYTPGLNRRGREIITSLGS